MQSSYKWVGEEAKGNTKQTKNDETNGKSFIFRFVSFFFYFSIEEKCYECAALKFTVALPGSSIFLTE
jgi:hypothetical protein